MWRDHDAGVLILGIETSCDETAAAVVDGGGDPSVERRRLAGRPACALRGRRARGGLPAPPRAGRCPWWRRRWTRPAVTARRSGRGCRHRGPGADRRAAGGAGDRQGDRLCPSPAAGAGRPPARPRRLALPRSRPAGRRRSCACSPRAATRCWPRWTTAPATSRSAARWTTPPGRRSTRAPACSAWAIPAGRQLERLAAGGDPAGDPFPVAMAGPAGPRLLVQRPQDRASPGRRPQPGEADRADLAASYQRGDRALAARADAPRPGADRPHHAGAGRRCGRERAAAQAFGGPLPALGG